VKKIIFLTSIFIFAVIMASCIYASAPSNVYVSPNGNDTNDGLTPGTAVQTINVGISLVADNGTVNLAAGTYNKTGFSSKDVSIEMQSRAASMDVGIEIKKNLTIAGAGKETTIIDALGTSQIFDIPGDVTVIIKDITFQNGYLANSGGAISSDGTLTVQNCAFKNNTAFDDGGGALFTHTTLNVVDCIFTGNTARAGGAIFNKGGSITVTGSTFIGNNALTDEKYSGGTIHNYGGSSYKIIGNTFLNNNGSAISITSWQPIEDSFESSNGALALINVNRIVGNSAYGIYMEPLQAVKAFATSGTSYVVDATNNWWGSNSNPKNNPKNIGGYIDGVLADSWLILTVSANPGEIPYGSTATVLAKLTINSNGQDTSSIGHIPDGTPITITTDIGNVGSKSVVKYTVNGIATAILRADDGIGTAHLYAIIDGFKTPIPAQVVIQPVTANAATVGMQETGIPLAGLAVAVLMVLGGLVGTRK